MFGKQNMFLIQKGRTLFVMNMCAETLPCGVITEYSRTLLIRNNCDGEPSDYA